MTRSSLSRAQYRRGLVGFQVPCRFGLVLGSLVLAWAARGQPTAPVLNQPANRYSFSVLTDGTTGAPRFDWPSGIAIGPGGAVYVADLVNAAIRKIDSDGTVTTWAGVLDVIGDVDGTGTAARFRRPYGLAIDGSGNVFVSDQYSATIRKVTPTRVVTTLAGTVGAKGTQDGVGSAARFMEPAGLAVDGAGNVIVADARGHTVRKIAPDGTVTTVAGLAATLGSADGSGSAARFNAPTGVAVDSSGNIFVADRGNHTLRKISATGVVTTVAGSAGNSGRSDGNGVAARFNAPSALTIDEQGNIYVADTWNCGVRRVSATGDVTTIAGGTTSGMWDATGAQARFGSPQGIAATIDGELMVADASNSVIRRITRFGVVSTFAGVAGRRGATDGTGAAFPLEYGQDVATDPAGNVYFSDGGRNIVQRMSPELQLSTVAGRVHVAGHQDGPGTTAVFDLPTSIAADAVGNVYVADLNNAVIRMISPAGVVSTLAGGIGQSGTANGVGEAARFVEPSDVEVDAAGNVYVADYYPGNGPATVIRKISPSKVVTTLAGSYGSPIYGLIDGVGTAAKFGGGGGLAIDGAGNLYLCEWAHGLIRKITAGGVVTTLRTEKGILPDCSRPVAIAAESDGHLILAAGEGEVLRRISPAGVVTTVTDSATNKSFPSDHRVVGVAVGRGGHIYAIENHGLATDTSEVVFRGTPIRNRTELPVFVVQPRPAGQETVSLYVGENRTFSVLASSASDFGYQWLKDGVRISGAIGSRLELTNCQISDSGLYSVVTTNAAGSAASEAVRLNVSNSPFTGTYFGSFEGGGDWAMHIRPDGTLVLIGYVAARRSVIIVNGTSDVSRSIYGEGKQYTAGTSSVSGFSMGGDLSTDKTRGTINLVRLGGTATVSSTGDFDSALGPLDAIGGYYSAPASGTTAGTAHMIFGPSRRAVLVFVADGIADGVGGLISPTGLLTGLTTIGSQFAATLTIADEMFAANLWPTSSLAPITFFVRVGAPTIADQPESTSVSEGGSTTLSIRGISGTAPFSYQWQHNGNVLPGSNASQWTIVGMHSAKAGLYTATVTGTRTTTSDPAIVGVATMRKVVGNGMELEPADIPHPNGNVFDQVLLTGAAETITADGGQVVRTSYVDMDHDIVQIEFSGRGTLSLVLDNPTGPTPPVNYYQPDVSYMKGHAGIVITGADQTTNVSVFSIGRATAFDPTGTYSIILPISATNDPSANRSPLFQGHNATVYDGVADLAFVAISSTDGKFGGVRTANANYFAAKGLTGIYAPGIAFQGPIYVGDINASDGATPVIVTGSAPDIRITGGDLFQINGRPVKVAGITRLRFTAGADSHGKSIPAATNRAVLQEDGIDVTQQVVGN